MLENQFPRGLRVTITHANLPAPVTGRVVGIDRLLGDEPRVCVSVPCGTSSRKIIPCRAACLTPA